MRSTLDELKSELISLNDFVESITYVSDALATHTNSDVRPLSALRRRFDNAAFVVALYASFENYVEKLAEAFATLESQRVPYNGLPQKLVTKHLLRSADLLARGKLGEGRHAGLTPAGVVANLHSCLHGTMPYALNTAAVLWHDTNFRAKDIDDMFSSLGIENMCMHLRSGDELIRWHMAVQGLPTHPPDGVPGTVIEERLNDLVERRNRVAHRGGNQTDLFGIADMKEAIDFIRALSTDIFSILAGYYLSSRYDQNPPSTRLTLVAGDGPFKKGTVIIVQTPTVDLNVGQPIFVRKSTGITRWGRIQSLQLNGVYHEIFPAGTAAPNGIGVALDFSCSDAAQPVVLMDEDDLVWTPKTD